MVEWRCSIMASKKHKPDKKLNATKIEKTKVKNKDKLKAIVPFYYIAFNGDNVIFHGDVKDTFSLTLTEDTEEYYNEAEYKDRLKELGL